VAHFETAYAWLAERTGFWPLFLSVGRGDWPVRMTGYDTQFGRRLATPETGNQVLFSWEREPHPGIVFSDYQAWHAVLNAVYWVDEESLGLGAIWPPGDVPRILAPWRDRAGWLRLARRRGGVQAVVPEMDLTSADAISCRNAATARRLERMGFSGERIRVWRVPVERWG